jgi:hypothetical protein
MKDQMSILNEMAAEKQKLRERIAHDTAALGELEATERVLKRLGSGNKSLKATVATNGAELAGKRRPGRPPASAKANVLIVHEVAAGTIRPGQTITGGPLDGQRITAIEVKAEPIPATKSKTTLGVGLDPVASIADQVMAKVGPSGGMTRTALYASLPGARPNHIGAAVARHLRAGRLSERDGLLYRGIVAASEHAAA